LDDALKIWLPRRGAAIQEMLLIVVFANHHQSLRNPRAVEIALRCKRKKLALTQQFLQGSLCH
jgi:hypothetical protein